MENISLPKNTVKIVVIVSRILCILGIISFMIPIIIGETFIYAPMIVFGVLFFIIFGLVSLAMNKEAKAFDRLMQGEDLIAYWELDKEDKESLIEEEYLSRTGMNIMLLIVVGFFCVLISIIFLIADFENGKYVALVLVMVWLVCLIFAIGVPKLIKKKTYKYYGVAYISKYSVYINGRFHYWNMFGSKLHNVSFNKSKKILEINYTYITRTGYMNELVLIPVPIDKKDEVDRIIRILQNK